MKVASNRQTAAPLFSYRLLMLALLLAYWFLMTRHLDRYPPIHYDEPIIVTPGYKLFTEGVYGSDLYTGFHRQEQIYLETPPLMPLLQGASTWLFGVGVWQMRYLALIAGLLLLPLTYAVGARVARSRWVGALAAGLLLTWRLTPGGDTFLGSGVTLLDVARIARYDILVPVLGLGSLLLWQAALGRPHPDKGASANDAGRTTPPAHRLFLGAGLLAGLAGFANPYGLFWIGALGAVWLVGALSAFAVGRPLFRRNASSGIAAFIVGLGIPWLAWGAILGLNWQAAAGQFVKHSGRFDLLTPAFYLDSVLREPHRYALGARQMASYGRLGFWLFLLGVPASTLWLAVRGWRRRDERVLFLLVPAVLIPLALALFESLKRSYYVVTVVPLFAAIVAWAVVALTRRMMGARRRALWLTVVALLTLLWTGQWVAGVGRWQVMAAEPAEPAAFFDDLRTLLPADSLTIGPPDYWFAFHDRAYRSLGLLFVRSSLRNPDKVSFLTALEQVSPDYLFLHPSLTDGLAVTDDFDGGSRKADFQRYMADHDAEVVAELTGLNGEPITIYRLAKTER